MQKIQVLLISDIPESSHKIKCDLTDAVEIDNELLFNDIDSLEVEKISTDFILAIFELPNVEKNFTSYVETLNKISATKRIPVIIYCNGDYHLINPVLLNNPFLIKIENLSPEILLNAIEKAAKIKKNNGILTKEPHLLFEAIENLMAPVLLLNLKGEILYINEAQESLHGFRKYELIGKDISILSYKEDFANSTKQIISEVIQKGKWNGELIEKTKSDEKIILSTKAKLLYDENDEPTAIILSAQNITSNKLLEEENKKFKQAIQHSHEVIFMTDKDGLINYVNSQFENFYQYSKEEVLGKKPSFLKSGNTPQDLYNQMWQNILGGKTFNAEMLNKSKFGQYLNVDASISPYFDEKNDIAGFISIQRDITEKKNNEELLRRALDKAEESDNLKAAFLNQMSHEIRTPLTSILGFMSLMEEELINRGITDLAVFFDSINRSSARLHRTIEDILSMSSIQIGNFYTSKSKINLVEILSLLVKEFSSFAREKNLEIHFKVETENISISADSYTITQSFKHLIDNALKFTDKGLVEIKIYDFDDSVCVDVIDTGIGISREYMNNLFKPFSQEEVGYNRRYDGNGLGLALTKEFLSLNNASIKVDSEKGKGSRFTISFYS